MPRARREIAAAKAPADLAQRPLSQAQPARATVTMQLHPQEAALIRYLRALRFGRLERLEVQDGVPVAAEEVRGRVEIAPVGAEEEAS